MELGQLGRQAPLWERARASCGVGLIVDLRGRRSRGLVEDALVLLENLEHRGARGAEENTGDGAGLLIQKPHEFFRAVVPELRAFGEDEYGVGQLFLPKTEARRERLKARIERLVGRRGFRAIAWRPVPTDAEGAGLGETARASEPWIEQLFVAPLEPLAPDELDLRLYTLRRAVEKATRPDVYVCTLSRRVTVYKGLLTNPQLRLYYPDLSDPRVRSSMALVHARFSTNTLGSWPLAQPMRLLAHNGEINTLRGNLNGVRAREADLRHPKLYEDWDVIKPVTHEDQSDTAVLDNVVELLVHAGRSLPQALRMLIPAAHRHDPWLSPEARAWYEYHELIVEPWDGPAFVAFTDGHWAGALLDRNGFRPARYALTRERLIVSSEAGVLPLSPREVVEKGRLRPGQMLLYDPEARKVLSEPELEERLGMRRKRYARWLRGRVDLAPLVKAQRASDRDGREAQRPDSDGDEEGLAARQRAFGYTRESVERLLLPMAEDGKDPVGAMGDDAPPPALSRQPKTLFHYFKQSFAQVTNPPIDYLREGLVTSLDSFLGPKGNLLTEGPEHAKRLRLASPVLRPPELDALKAQGRFPVRELDLTFPRSQRLEGAVEALLEGAERAVLEGAQLLVLTDRSVSKERLAIPSLLATAGVHHHLIRKGLRARASLVVESGEPHLVHHLCVLLGYGADAVCPYLAYETLRALVPPDAYAEAEKRYVHALEDGLLKVMAKMGISVLESYKGAQLFDALGLGPRLIEKFFPGTASPLGGLELEDVERELRERHARAFGPQAPEALPLEAGGDLYWRRDGEAHLWTPETIGTLQWAARTANPRAYKMFSELCRRQLQELQALRGLLELNTERAKPIPLDRVEPVEAIVKRFFASSMSYGALSPEAHETLAIAMNKLGAVASSGEGGEPEERYGTVAACKNRQVASGRFGVTVRYLRTAWQLEIKMAQGAKPGEGGQLPGHKVNEEIARVRHTVPGVELISPPPHHDIYSIEDLAQLIYDLRQANPDAEVHVKLVSRVGVGTVAAGVAKAGADAILIAGDSGGTGASPKTSIKHAGLPWELGLAEAQRVLREQGLRSRVKLRVDGGLRTGHDVLVAALLGAEEFGFGTALLISLGCVMLRKCHCNTCSVGVATQDPRLRRRFRGKPEHVMNYLRFVAEEVRALLARLGLRSLDEAVGRTDLLKPRALRPKEHRKAAKLDVSKLLERPEGRDAPRRVRPQPRRGYVHPLDQQLLERTRPALERGRPVRLSLRVTNHDRAFGTRLSGEVVRRHPRGLPDHTLYVKVEGTAGQSFGAFLAQGITLHLVGEANDYVGKGLSGGKIVVQAPPGAAYDPERSVAIGNVALYGATAGELYVQGRAGERFAVRNSGAYAVVEGVGDHGCEYMTGGVVVVLGPIGKNFGAGMSGGEAYLLDAEGVDVFKALGRQRLRLEPVRDGRDVALVRRLLENHWAYTRSPKAERLLDDWARTLERLWKVVPPDYDAALKRYREKGVDLRPPLPPGAPAPLRTRGPVVSSALDSQPASGAELEPELVHEG